MPSLSMVLIWRYAAAAVVALIPFSIIFSVITVDLAQKGTPAAAIGLFAAVPFLVLLVAMPLLPTVQARLGRARSFKGGLALGVVAALAFLLGDGYAARLLAAGLLGISAALQWGLAETQIAENAPVERVGRVTGLYQTVVALGLAIGPVMPGLFGWTVATSLAVATALSTAAFLPILGIPDRSIDLQPTRRQPLNGLASARLLVTLAPALFAAALAGGLFESGLNAMVAVQAIGIGFDGESALGLIGAIAFGSLVSQYPLGVLADRVSVGRLILASALILVATGAVLPLAPAWPRLLWPLALVWGAVGGGLYTLAMTHVGTVFRAERAALATSLVIGSYTLGSLVGPLVGGALHDASPSHGLAILLALAAGALALLMAAAPLETPREPAVGLGEAGRTG